MFQREWKKFIYSLSSMKITMLYMDDDVVYGWWLRRYVKTNLILFFFWVYMRVLLKFWQFLLSRFVACSSQKDVHLFRDLPIATDTRGHAILKVDCYHLIRNAMGIAKLENVSHCVSYCDVMSWIFCGKKHQSWIREEMS